MKASAKLATRLLGPGLSIALAAGALAARPEARVASTEATEANITRLTAGMLAGSQFAHQRLDAELAGKFLDAYLDALDGRRVLFLQSDVEEFAPYRATLARATREGNTSASQAIWARYLQRVRERTAYVRRALHTASFDFTGQDTYSFDREHAERPRGAAAAQRRGSPLGSPSARPWSPWDRESTRRPARGAAPRHRPVPCPLAPRQ